MPDRQGVRISYFSDVLCIWAYISHARVAEIDRQFGDSVRVDYHFCPVFGNSAEKIERGWSERDGHAGFNRHLLEVAAQYPHVEVNPDIWLHTRPCSSDSAHVFIKAVQNLARRDEAALGDREIADVIWHLRTAFFRDCRDIAARDVQCEIVEEIGLPRAPIEREIDCGAAFAALASDYRAREELKVEGSPTFVLNHGRQKLYGNVGYRVIEANIREFLRSPGAGEISWC